MIVKSLQAAVRGGGDQPDILPPAAVQGKPTRHRIPASRIEIVFVEHQILAGVDDRPVWNPKRLEVVGRVAKIPSTDVDVFVGSIVEFDGVGQR